MEKVQNEKNIWMHNLDFIYLSTIDFFKNTINFNLICDFFLALSFRKFQYTTLYQSWMLKKN